MARLELLKSSRELVLVMATAEEILIGPWTSTRRLSKTELQEPSDLRSGRVSQDSEPVKSARFARWREGYRLTDRSKGPKMLRRVLHLPV